MYQRGDQKIAALFLSSFAVFSVGADAHIGPVIKAPLAIRRQIGYDNTT